MTDFLTSFGDVDDFDPPAPETAPASLVVPVPIDLPQVDSEQLQVVTPVKEARQCDAVCLPQELALAPVALETPIKPARCRNVVDLRVTGKRKDGERLGGKVGRGRHGGLFERSYLSYHMRTMKALRRHRLTEDRFEDIVQHMQVYSHARHQLLVSYNRCKYVSVKQRKMVLKGNRHKRSIPLAWYLLHVFHGRPVNTSTRSRTKMNSSVAMSALGLQVHLLARLGSWMANDKPSVCLVRKKWDEASNSFRVRIKGLSDDIACNTASTWSIMVCRMRIWVAWPSGRTVVMNVVVPPTLMTGKTAEDQWNQLHHHPVFSVVCKALAFFADHSSIYMDLANALSTVHHLLCS